jgi:hypothetical protein
VRKQDLLANFALHQNVNSTNTSRSSQSAYRFSLPAFLCHPIDLRYLINCPGCRPRNKKCAFLKGHCSKLSKGEVTFCFECASFPCDRLRTIDSRYRSRYRMSMIENLSFIKENGMEKFLECQEETWKCQNCGELISCHNGLCFNCDLEKLKNKKQKYRWNEQQAP